MEPRAAMTTPKDSPQPTASNTLRQSAPRYRVRLWVIEYCACDVVFIDFDSATAHRKKSLKVAAAYLQYLYVRWFYDRSREPKAIGPRRFAALGVSMAIQDYVRSIAATDTVSKTDVF